MLDCAGNMDQVFVDHGNKGYVMLGREGAVDFAERSNVVGAVIRGQGNASQQYFGVGLFERCQHLIEIAAGLFQGQAAQAVVAAKFDDDHLGMKPNNRRKGSSSVFRGGSAGALIDDLIVVALGAETARERVRKGLALLQPIAGGNAVSKANQYALAGSLKGRRKKHE